MSKVRVYNFALPAHFGSWQVWAGMKIHGGNPAWKKLPTDFRQRIEHVAETAGSELLVTKDDLDKLDDATWGEVAQVFGLPYEYMEL